jgi:hypothetical protein
MAEEKTSRPSSRKAEEPKQPKSSSREPAEEAEEEPKLEKPQPEADAERLRAEDRSDELAKINAAVRPMRAADGRRRVRPLQERQGRQHPGAGAEVAGMLEHGFVLVDDEA